MHSFANLATVQTPLVTFFPSKKRLNLIWSQRIAGTAAWGLAFSARAHTSLSLSSSVCSVSVQHAHTHTHLSLSLCICSVSVQHVYTHHSLSRLSDQFIFSTHTSLSLSFSLGVCSVSVQRAHTHLSLSLSRRLLSFCSACGREEQRARA